MNEAREAKRPESELVIKSEDLPAAEEMPFEALASSYVTVNRIGWCGLFGAAIVVFTVVNLFTGNGFQALIERGIAPFIAAGAIALFIATMVGAKITWLAQGYQLQDSDLHYRHGVIWRGVTSLPFARVQHVELESGPLDRFFKLATLKFFTAGGGTADMTIPGLPFGTASKLRAFVLERAGEENDAPAAQAGEQ